jgi:hypothetical protein
MYPKLNSSRKEIRLLSIRPPINHDTLIECDLQVFDLDKAPPFDAVSYVWGDPTTTKAIRLCGSPAPVTLNLFAALARLRHKVDIIWLWIDALCINQSNTLEKNSQILIMRHIYRRAHRVISWFGEAEEDSGLAISLIERWADAILSTSPSLETWPNVPAIRSAVADISRPFDKEGWAALGTIFRNVYWGRAWIIQEVLLAENCLILLGDYEIPFNKVKWCYRTWLSGHLRLPQLDQLFRSVIWDGGNAPVYSFMRFLLDWEDAGTKAPDARGKIVRITKGYRLERLPFILKRASALSATDARDKIYALLGLLDVEELPIPVDYDSTIEEAYTKATWGLIDGSGRLDILAFAGTGSLNDTRNLSLPSWVPDCRTHHFDVRFCEDMSDCGMMFFNALAKTKAVCSVEFQYGKRIRVRGFLCDEIVATAAPSWDAVERFRRWLIFILENQHRLRVYQLPLQQILFRTMVVDHLWRGSVTPQFLASYLEYEFCRIVAGFLAAIRYIYENKPIPYFEEENVASAQIAFTPEVRQRLAAWLRSEAWHDDGEHSKQSADIQNFVGQSRLPGSLRWPADIKTSEAKDETNLVKFRYHFRMTDSRCLFITKQGYIGVGPGKAREGDRIFIPLGCCLPMTIRGDTQGFELIGDTFVPGMMQGEMMVTVEHGGLGLEDIPLN